ncbi:hypothetical protein [Salinibacter altiplanensis]|nr:hypothetical protein [Salinibacter altiplanensis]
MNTLKVTLGFVELTTALFLGLALYMTSGLLGARRSSQPEPTDLQ